MNGSFCKNFEAILENGESKCEEVVNDCQKDAQEGIVENLPPLHLDETICDSSATSDTPSTLQNLFKLMVFEPVKG